MENFTEALQLAFSLMVSWNEDLAEITFLSLRVSLTAVTIAVVAGLPLGAFLAVKSFYGRRFLIGILTALMGLPPVVAGLFLYLFLSRSGSLGALEILYTPLAMILVQVMLVFPIITVLTHQTIHDLDARLGEQLRSFGCSNLKLAGVLLWEGRYSLLTAVLAGFGRAIGEVGGVLIVGGNINHHTRIMTTTIALETSKGNLSLALALGIILVTIALLASFLAQALGDFRKLRTFS